MSIVRTLIGNIKGPAGATGATGATGAAGANGADGAAATVNVGTVSTTAYGNPAQVINSGTESAAVLDFVIPQGQPGEEVTDMSGLTLGTMTTQTAQYPTPQVGDNGATLWGKVVKYFSDLRTAIGTKLNTANVVNNFTTTQSGYALDARAGKTLLDSITTTNGYILSGTLPNNTDFNNVTAAGRYVINGGSTYTNAPDGITWGMLEVVRGSATGNSYFQRVSQGDRIYQRYHMTADWGDWYRFICEDENTTFIAYMVHTYAYTLAAGASKTVKANEFTPVMGTPTGRSLLGIRTFNTGSTSVVPIALQHGQNNDGACIIKNTSNSSVSGTLTVGYNYVKNTFISALS